MSEDNKLHNFLELLPFYLHHETIKKNIRSLIIEEKITKEEGNKLYILWRRERRLGVIF